MAAKLVSQGVSTVETLQQVACHNPQKLLPVFENSVNIPGCDALPGAENLGMVLRELSGEAEARRQEKQLEVALEHIVQKTLGVLLEDILFEK